MDLLLGKKGLDFAVRNRRWVLLAAFGFSSYGAFKVYHSPTIARKRERISKIFGAFVSLAEAVSDSAEAVGVVSRDLRDFMLSESDQIPNSFKQISKIAKSDDVFVSLVRATQALTTGLLRGYRSESRFSDYENAGSGFVDQVMDKLFTKAGTGFASVLIGSFARNLVTAFCSNDQPSASYLFETDYVSKWVDVVCTEDRKKLLGDCIQVFVSTAVAVYLEKTMNINTYDEFFAGLTNPKHQTRVRDVLVSVCNGAVETLVKTSHRELGKISDFDPKPDECKRIGNGGGRGGRVSTTLALPSNRRFIVDLTGRVTFETVRAFLELLHEKLNKYAKSCVDCAMESGVEAARCVSLKSSVFASLCITLCLHILEAPWLFVPA